MRNLIYKLRIINALDSLTSSSHIKEYASYNYIWPTDYLLKENNLVFISRTSLQRLIDRKC